MDANKLEVLRDIYHIYPTCALCESGQFNDATNWGTCAKQTYQDEKHSDSERQLSINRSGSCDGWRLDRAKFQELGAFGEFLSRVV